jgi:hypothetical protein
MSITKYPHVALEYDQHGFLLEINGLSVEDIASNIGTTPDALRKYYTLHYDLFQSF